MVWIVQPRQIRDGGARLAMITAVHEHEMVTILPHNEWRGEEFTLHVNSIEECSNLAECYQRPICYYDSSVQDFQIGDIVWFEGKRKALIIDVPHSRRHDHINHCTIIIDKDRSNSEFTLDEDRLKRLKN